MRLSEIREDSTSGSEMSSQHFRFHVDSTKIIQSSSQKFALYEIRIESPARIWKINKRYSQLLQFHRDIMKGNAKLKPRLAKFNFPPKNWFGKFKAEVIEFRKTSFQDYFNILAEYLTFWDSDMACQFLEIDDRLRELLKLFVVGSPADSPKYTTTSILKKSGSRGFYGKEEHKSTTYEHKLIHDLLTNLNTLQNVGMHIQEFEKKYFDTKMKLVTVLIHNLLLGEGENKGLLYICGYKTDSLGIFIALHLLCKLLNFELNSDAPKFLTIFCSVPISAIKQMNLDFHILKGLFMPDSDALVVLFTYISHNTKNIKVGNILDDPKAMQEYKDWVFKKHNQSFILTAHLNDKEESMFIQKPRKTVYNSGFQKSKSSVGRASAKSIGSSKVNGSCIVRFNPSPCFEAPPTLEQIENMMNLSFQNIPVITDSVMEEVIKKTFELTQRVLSEFDSPGPKWNSYYTSDDPTFFMHTKNGKYFKYKFLLETTLLKNVISYYWDINLYPQWAHGLIRGVNRKKYEGYQDIVQLLYKDDKGAIDNFQYMEFIFLRNLMQDPNDPNCYFIVCRSICEKKSFVECIHRAMTKVLIYRFKLMEADKAVEVQMITRFEEPDIKFYLADLLGEKKDFLNNKISMSRLLQKSHL